MSVRPAHRRIALLVALGLAWVAGSAIGATQPVRRAAAAPLFQIEQAHAEFVPVLDGSKPIFILVIGSDARPDEVATETRADSLHIVAINLEKHKATIVGIPRDSYVDIPGYGSNKITPRSSTAAPSSS
jgi:anionic cell wall polymer biosynthesis LytR-Cps2A-Psr (LCP) family protein